MNTELAELVEADSMLSARRRATTLPILLTGKRGPVNRDFSGGRGAVLHPTALITTTPSCLFLFYDIRKISIAMTLLLLFCLLDILYNIFCYDNTIYISFILFSGICFSVFPLCAGTVLEAVHTRGKNFPPSLLYFFLANARVLFGTSVLFLYACVRQMYVSLW